MVSSRSAAGGSGARTDSENRSASAATRPAILDLRHLERQVRGDALLRDELLRLYAGRLVALAPVVCGPSVQERREAAHALRGASLAIGAFALADACQGIETDGGEQACQKAALLIEGTQRRIETLLGSPA